MTMIELEPQPRIDTGTATWIQVHIQAHIGWPAGVGYRVVTLTPTDAVR